jgi:acetyl-CoA carboxylase biotin carboxylase subunit
MIVKGKDRAEALARGRRALELFIVEGVKTSIPLHRAIVDDPRFISGDFSTRFMESFSW